MRPFALLAASLLWASTALAAPQNLEVQSDGSFVYALVYKAGVASAVAHDHVVHAPKLTGEAVYDAESVAGSSINVTADVMGIVTDSDELRKIVGLNTFLSDNQREEILGHIRAKYQLYADEYTTIKFESTSVGGTKDELEVTGNFTLRGVSKQITVPLTITQEGEGLIARGKFQILQSDFGYSPFSALFGALKVKDQVDIFLKVNLQPSV